jgi:hypothetical protein
MPQAVIVDAMRTPADRRPRGHGSIFGGSRRNDLKGPAMQRLSRPTDQMHARYSAVVVGSGYGGAIAAGRIARTGRDVCVLERGRGTPPRGVPELRRNGAA